MHIWASEKMWIQIRLCMKMSQFLIKSVLLMLSNAYLAELVFRWSRILSGMRDCPTTKSAKYGSYSISGSGVMTNHLHIWHTCIWTHKWRGLISRFLSFFSEITHDWSVKAGWAYIWDFYRPRSREKMHSVASVCPSVCGHNHGWTECSKEQ